MTPTPKLRFVERIEKFVTEPYGVSTGRNIRILQQWWQVASTGQITTNGEWRDVPLEKEND
jgi:hypothetical protein